MYVENLWWWVILCNTIVLLLTCHATAKIQTNHPLRSQSNTIPWAYPPDPMANPVASNLSCHSHMFTNLANHHSVILDHKLITSTFLVLLCIFFTNQVQSFLLFLTMTTYQGLSHPLAV